MNGTVSNLDLASLPSTARPLHASLPSQQQDALQDEFETSVFDDGPNPVGSSPSTTDAVATREATLESLVRMFCISTMYREAFNSDEWGKEDVDGS